MHFQKSGFHPGRCVAVLLAIALTFAATPLRAAGLEDALAHFVTDDYGDIQDGITAVAESGDPRAALIIEALQDGRLSYSAGQKKVFYKDQSGKLFDAVTAMPVGNGPADIDTVGINNRLRRALDAALGSLTLMSPDRTKRYDAAQAVFKSREANVLPAINSAIEKETDARIKRALNEARAAIILNGDDADEADKLAAVAVIRARGDQDAVALLQGLPADTPAAVSDAAKRAIAAMAGDLARWELAQNAWYGLSLGSVLTHSNSAGNPQKGSPNTFFHLPRLILLGP
jgi:urea transport system permease protein